MLASCGLDLSAFSESCQASRQWVRMSSTMLTKAVSSSLAALTDLVRATAGSTTWAPVVNVSRRAVCMLLSRIEHGQLSIIDVDGGVIRFGDGLGDSTKGKKVELRVQREAFWVRLFLFSDMVCPRDGAHKAELRH